MLFLFVPVTAGIYLPGVTPQAYGPQATVPVRARELFSMQTQIPLDFSTLLGDRCQVGGDHRLGENLGELLSGGVSEATRFDLKLGVSESCKPLCSERGTADIESLIRDGYMAQLTVDSLPAAVKVILEDGSVTYQLGLPLGWTGVNGSLMSFNHFMFRIEINRLDPLSDLFWVVGVEVQPRSYSDSNCQGSAVAAANFTGWTYGIEWIENTEKKWATRWDVYLSLPAGSGDIHWLAIVNSVVVALLLATLMALLLRRALASDFARYEAIAGALEIEDESGWKLLHGDVFRSPSSRRWLCACIGTGAQLAAVSGVVILLAAIGFLSPAIRGTVLSTGLLLFSLSGGIGGWVAARFLRTFSVQDGSNREVSRAVLFITALGIPGTAFVIFSLLNMLLWIQGSVAAVPLTSFLSVVFLWLGVSAPLVLIGAAVAARADPIAIPCRVNAIPRPLPSQIGRPWYTRGFLLYGVAGILPFGAIFTELFFIMASLWQHQIYFLFGVLSVVGLVFMLTCAEVSIAVTYFRLSSEDYRWWWPAFWASASSGVWVFAYSIFYLATKLHVVSVVGVLVYLGYMFIISATVSLIGGATGFLASFQFARVIFAGIKSE